jgi:hypothetical protein
MKIRHNKKRNTAFVYEALIREITVAVIKNDLETKEKAISILKKHFQPNSVLNRHLECYRSLYETSGLDKNTCQKIINEAKMASRLLDAHGLFVSQSDLIDDVNKDLSPKIFNNFVPNYKTLASIYQIFSLDTPPKNSIILENQLIDDMSSGLSEKNTLEPIDNIVLNSFVTKFNEKYANTLAEEQKTLLTLYISSFSDNSLSLRSFLNEEISRLKVALVENYDKKEFIEDSEMKTKAEKIVELLESYSARDVDDNVLSTVLKTQQLVRELSDGSHN